MQCNMYTHNALVGQLGGFEDQVGSGKMLAAMVLLPGCLGFLPAILAMCLRALAAAPLLAWGQVNKVGDSRGSLRASLACVIQLCWVLRKILAGQGNVYACAAV